MEAYLVDWLNLLVRWLHVIAGVAWIGASFYFVMLDNSLSPPKKPEDAQRGVFGELWAVHGGGFYNSRKYLTGPKGEPLPANLHWSKWEAYTTWLSGMGLLAIIYWYGASSFLIDRSVLPLAPGAAVAISLAFVIGGWVVYDLLCRLLAARESLLAAAMLALVMAAAWALFHVFGARAAYVHVGAMIGTMMVANVFFHIIPGQKRMVADIRAGRDPDPTPGQIGKQRSVHNTYFTLPVLFVMISNHYPMTYSHPYGWVVLGVIMLSGVLIRQFFVLRHRGRTTWALPALAAVLLLGLVVAIAPAPTKSAGGDVTFEQVKTVLNARCVGCHAAQPTQAGFAQPPKGVVLESAEQIGQNAAKIAETVGNRYMPIGNLTRMTDEERGMVAAWFAQGAKH
ncbi:MAG: urate hydroxylase PuuD [Betaproteobacteria bacterium]|jgi:uncharacterized membrane protein|nr:urate hydroxylase PuuD [Betaproteobacteria bacterium]